MSDRSHADGPDRQPNRVTAFMFATGIENSYPDDPGRPRARRPDGEVRPLRALARGLRAASRSSASASCATARRCTRTLLGPGRYDWEFADVTFAELRRRDIVPDRRPLPLRRAGLDRRLPEPGLPGALRRLRRAPSPQRFPWVQLYTPVNEMFICAPVLRRATAGGTSSCTTDRGLRHRAQAHRARPTCWRCRRSSRCGPTRSSSRASRSEYFHAENPAAIKPAEIANARALPLARPQLRPPRRLGDVRVPDGQRHDPGGVPLLPAATRCSTTASWATTTTSTNEHRVARRRHAPRASGEIFGYYEITRQYYDRYRLPVMHTETNIAEGPNGDEAVNWLWKQWANVLRVRNDGVPIVGFTWYSLTDQVDWDTALREQRPGQPARALRPRPQHPARGARLQAAISGLARGAADPEHLPLSCRSRRQAEYERLLARRAAPGTCATS